ncbi:MAG: hypothetical protein M5U26_21830 [Planctomycetota bacterium]|nr:hypothetical protein [Planctomycetota bacterium]
MKIGSLDVTIPSLVYAALVVVLGVVNFKLYESKVGARAQGRRIHALQMKLADGNPQSYQEGAELSREILAAEPRCVPAHLWLATFLYLQQKYEEAQEEYEVAAEMEAASAEQRAEAWSGAACAVFARLGEDRREAGIEEAGKRIAKALQAKDDHPDALVAQGILDLWKNEDGSSDKALKTFETVLAGKAQPSIHGAAALHNARGVALSRKGQGAMADAAFVAAEFVKPEWKAPEENRRLSVITSLMEPDMPLDRRQALIDKYIAHTKDFGSQEGLVMNALAVGLWQTKKDLKTRDYVEKAYPKALKLLRSAVQKYPKDPQGYWNIAGLLQDRIWGDVRDAEDSGLMGRVAEDLRDPDYYRQGSERRNLSAEEVGVINDLKGLSRQLGDILGTLLEKVKLKPEKRLRAEKLMFSALELQLVCEATSTDRSRIEKPIRAQADALLEHAEQDAEAVRIVGFYELGQGRYQTALRHLRKAQELGAKGPDVAAFVEQLSRPPVFMNIRPRKGHWFGARPLVSATVLAASCPGPVKLELTYDGKPQNAAVKYGTQIVFYPEDSLLTDGSHEVRIDGEDAAGNAAQHAFKVYVDRQPPTGSATLQEGANLPRPVFKVVLADAGVGVDLTSVRVTLKSMSPKSTPINADLVRNGAYEKDQPGAKAKDGERLPGESFLVASYQDLAPGAYGLKIVFSDLAGNDRTVDAPFNFE